MHSTQYLVYTARCSAFTNRTAVFTSSALSVGDLGSAGGGNKWFLSNATAATVAGALQVSADAWGLNSSMYGKTVYGTSCGVSALQTPSPCP